MVEGPGATNNGKKVQKIIQSCRRNQHGHGRPLVQSVRIRPCNNATLMTKQSGLQERLVGRVVVDVFSVGKEVFVILATTDTTDKVHTRNHVDSSNDNGGFENTKHAVKTEMALRLHFGMNGTLKVGTSKSELQPRLPPWQRNSNGRTKMDSTEVMEMEFVNEIFTTDTYYIETRASTYNFVTAVVARSKFTRLSHLDVCSDCFDSGAVVTKLKEKGKDMNISDALLNQDIFPGVGNIIKIESLHNAHIDPRKSVHLLSTDELERVLQCCREFSLAWLRTKSSGSKNVYNRTECGTCGGEVSMQRIGGARGLPRTTFWCSICQPYEKITNENIVNAQQGNQKKSNNFNSFVFCPQHGMSRVRIRRCRKNQNNGRIFAICSAYNCQYFKWADDHLPRCKCGHKSIMKISKTANTGGKWFLSCSKNQIANDRNHKGCNYFEWVTAAQKLPFGSKLTPLL